MPQESKPGIKTTEFWVTIFTNIIGLIQVSTTTLDSSTNKWVVIGLAVINGLYAASRGIAKSGQPYLPPEPDYAPANTQQGQVQRQGANPQE
jgi:hypothetical protein